MICPNQTMTVYRERSVLKMGVTMQDASWISTGDCERA